MKWLFASFILMCLGCSSRIHTLAEYTTFKLDYHKYLVNDSLQLHFKTPADIDYPETKKGLKKALRKSEIKSEKDVIVYGKTKYPPYEYVVTVSDSKQERDSGNYVVFDTIINNRTICFIGNPLVEDARRSLTIDLKNMLLSINKLETEK